ncbi:hypothetical protein SAMN06265171_1202 [Chryseobacterium rhizoplanae]|uniref:RiboL-PSP-HEPN domain-containing protein n=1 Tax=Chryseobacterium rhizoplanae TaxID=1609531 RepID=A0A521FLU9_9FLAO|nr:hypothetical protein [Chryseobacterium rhizoplanae]SMO97119.1 hypothetical protein SAMN06265171_1202 [Chryseobacterium rhizoplanae]
MKELNEKIQLAIKLLGLVTENTSYSDKEDIRSITIDSIAETLQSFYISLLLSKELHNIEYINSKISPQFKESDLDDIQFNFEGLVKDALFTKFFICIESNLRSIARHFEAAKGNIEKTSIKATFENLFDVNKTDFFTSIKSNDKDVILFFFYLRNTMHNFGIHSDSNPNQIIQIEDTSSVIDRSKVTLELIQNQTNNIIYKDLLLLFEQVIKIIIRLNSLIPSTEKIKHPLADFGL